MTAIGALIGLALAIFLIIKKVAPVYSLMLGALAGGLAGGMGLVDTVANMISGVNDVTSAVVRILAAGVLSGVLVVTGAATSISNSIIRTLGERHVYEALALATMILTATGVFVDIAVITVAPVALSVGRRLNLSTPTLLVMLIGGGKCGNIISPNPNTIICAENFHADLYSVMYANLIPAIIGLLFTVYVVGAILRRRDRRLPVEKEAAAVDEASSEAGLPSFTASISGPVVAIVLLALRPLTGITIDPLVALPAGGVAGIVFMGRWRQLGSGIRYGLEKMSGVAILLIGTGTIAGIIKASTLKDVLLDGLSAAGISEALLAPVSGMIMSAATASTTAGATVASSSFADTILAAGVSAVWGAAMINSGSTVCDHLPHGSFFHATGGSVEMGISERLRLIPYESLIGFVLALSTVAAYYIS